MGITACCCCSSKDAAITIGIWSLVSSIGQLGIMGWQMAAIKYERDRAANTLLPNYNTYGRFDVPSYFESYWQTPEERYYTGLFVIQVLCLIAAFFLVFAAAAMIYGIHTWSKYLIWPWFPTMISSILATLAYCIMWWCGDVRDYWLAITIIEIIVVFINIYCVVVVMVYYRRINATTDEYEGKDRRGVRYNINRNGNSRRDLLQSYDDGVHRSPPMKYKPIVPQPYPVYPSYSRAGVPQTPIPLPPTQINTPYPIDPQEIQFQLEPKVKNIRVIDDDPVGSWVRDQQSIERGHEARSEPITVSKQVQPTTLQHSRSVPSLHGGTLVSHRDCDHRDDKHRSSSRDENPEVVMSTMTILLNPIHLISHANIVIDRVVNEDTEVVLDSMNLLPTMILNWIETERDDGQRDTDTVENERRRRDREDRESEVPRRREGDRRSRHQDSQENSGGSQEMSFPLSGGITIPQHIVIPPSSGERGPDGNPVPQKYQINSEITINYDHNGRPVVGPREPQPTIEEPYRRRQVLPIQSTF
ncbi:Protein CBG18288 [Caenorhabditis briggsae]|uniref:Protein CBG18288 n=1 Tax=Caenorhabditis briggsae TaxID=6238 RepID=A8XSC3_CAEBR|nr:Protein CBG18288 [Caenorhabditis briggsae]CAP35765.2 Protein CBG18288 [Caenorhabditis briggsae]